MGTSISHQTFLHYLFQYGLFLLLFFCCLSYFFCWFVFSSDVVLQKKILDTFKCIRSAMLDTGLYNSNCFVIFGFIFRRNHSIGMNWRFPCFIARCAHIFNIIIKYVLLSKPSDLRKLLCHLTGNKKQKYDKAWLTLLHLCVWAPWSCFKHSSYKY